MDAVSGTSVARSRRSVMRDGGRQDDRVIDAKVTRLLRGVGRVACPGMHGLALLVVTLDPERRERLTSALSAQGHHVVTAPGATEAAAALGVPGLDGVVVDLSLPGLDAAALGRALTPAADPPPGSLEDAERRHIAVTLAHTKGNKAAWRSSSAFPARPSCTRSAAMDSRRWPGGARPRGKAGWPGVVVTPGPGLRRCRHPSAAPAPGCRSAHRSMRSRPSRDTTTRRWPDPLVSVQLENPIDHAGRGKGEGARAAGERHVEPRRAGRGPAPLGPTRPPRGPRAAASRRAP